MTEDSTSSSSGLLGPQRLLDAEFDRRHGIVTRILVAQLPVLLVVGLLRQAPLTTLAAEISAVALLGLLARQPIPSRVVRVGASTLGLVVACTAVVHLAGGLPEAHLYFLVALTAVAFYRDLRVVGAVLLWVAGFNVVLAVATPVWVGTTDPPGWALGLLRTGYLLAVAAFYRYAWRHSDRDRGDRDALRDRLHDQMMRQRQALEINDTIVQGLATAHYAMELGETDMAADSVERTLASARGIITDLLGGEDFAERRSLVREVAAAPRELVEKPAIALNLTQLPRLSTATSPVEGAA